MKMPNLQALGVPCFGRQNSRNVRNDSTADIDASGKVDRSLKNVLFRDRFLVLDVTYCIILATSPWRVQIGADCMARTLSPLSRLDTTPNLDKQDDHENHHRSHASLPV